MSIYPYPKPPKTQAITHGVQHTLAQFLHQSGPFYRTNLEINHSAHIRVVAVPAPENSEFNLVAVFNQASAFISLTALQTHHVWSESLWFVLLGRDFSLIY